MNVGVEI